MKRFFRIFFAIAVILHVFVFSSGSFSVKAEDAHPLLNNVVSDAAIVMDRDTGQILDEKNADEKIYPASMTKMMTAILAIENLPDLDQTITITNEMLAGLLEANAATAGFQAGDQPTVRDLLYGAALPSGADASNALSYTITNANPSAFITMMNDKAKEIGMMNTNFVNDTGLHDVNHYSTVRDMAKLLQYCLKNRTFTEIFSAKEYTTSPLASAPDGLHFHSTMWKAASGYDTKGLIGGKTGYTENAGHCLASWSEVNGMRLITITAHADTPMNEMTHLQDAGTILTSLQSWSKQTLVKKNEIISQIHVQHPFSEESIPVKAKQKVTMDLPENTSITRTCNIAKTASVRNTDQKLKGELILTSSDQQILYTKEITVTIPAESNPFKKIVIWFQNLVQK